MGQVFAGIGCRRGCGEADLLAALDAATDQAGVCVTALAAPEFKFGEAALHAASSARGLPILWQTDAALAVVRPFTESAASRRATGLGSVAEASALAAAGMGARLLAPRTVRGAATCALAIGDAFA